VLEAFRRTWPECLRACPACPECSRGERSRKGSPTDAGEHAALQSPSAAPLPITPYKFKPSHPSTHRSLIF
jgi:hypothetical protein